MSAKYKPNDLVFVRMNDYSVHKGCVYCVVQKTYMDRIEYAYQIQYAKNKVETFPQDVIYATMEEAFV